MFLLMISCGIHMVREAANMTKYNATFRCGDERRNSPCRWVAGTAGFAPVIENGRILVPLCAVTEALGYSADWEQKLKCVSIESGREKFLLYHMFLDIYGLKVMMTVAAAPRIVA